MPSFPLGQIVSVVVANCDLKGLANCVNFVWPQCLLWSVLANCIGATRRNSLSPLLSWHSWTIFGCLFSSEKTLASR